MNKRQEIFDKIEGIFELCDKRNIGSNEAELDTKETITDYICKNFFLYDVVKSLPSKKELSTKGYEIGFKDKKENNKVDVVAYACGFIDGGEYVKGNIK